MIYACFQEVGIQAERMSASNLSTCYNIGNRVLLSIADIKQVAPGDILFFRNRPDDPISYCGVCVEDGKMVMASSIEGKVVEVSYEDEAYLGDFVKALRLSAPLPAVEPAAPPPPARGNRKNAGDTRRFRCNARKKMIQWNASMLPPRRHGRQPILGLRRKKEMVREWALRNCCF